MFRVQPLYHNVMIGTESKPGSLYVVATPIGNLADITPRACEVLSQVSIIAAEDTRHSAGLLQRFSINTPMLSLHDHNEEQRVAELLPRLLAGESIALISDAGTPLMSDPGFRLVRAAANAGIAVVAVPGASAVLAALSVAGLPTDRFQFEGFLPPKQGARQQRLKEIAGLRHTLVLFESPKRLRSTLLDIAEVLGLTRQCVVARELTKMHEEVLRGSPQELLEALDSREGALRGEIVLMIAGDPTIDAQKESVHIQAQHLLDELAKELPPARAAATVARLTGLRKNELYARLQAANKESAL